LFKGFVLLNFTVSEQRKRFSFTIIDQQYKLTMKIILYFQELLIHVIDQMQTKVVFHYGWMRYNTCSHRH